MIVLQKCGCFLSYRSLCYKQSRVVVLEDISIRGDHIYKNAASQRPRRKHSNAKIKLSIKSYYSPKMRKEFRSKEGMSLCHVDCLSDSPIFVITMTNREDNRLTTEFCQAMLNALRYIEEDIGMMSDLPSRKAAVVTVGGVQKFYSNGLDLEHTASTPNYWRDSFYALLIRILEFRVPMIAAINGHAFAGGLIFAMCHDYRVGNQDKGFLCLNEIHLGVPIPQGVLHLVSTKVERHILRKCVFEGHRFGGVEQLEAGLVDVIVPADQVLSAGIGLATRVAEFAKGNIYGKLKVELNRQTVELLTVEEHENHVRRMIKCDSKL